MNKHILLTFWIIFSAMVIQISMFNSMEANAEETRNQIAGYIKNSDVLTSFEEASEKSNLFQKIESLGPLTFFAPTDEAWEALPEDIVNAINDDPEGKLLTLLMYHFVNDKLQSHKLEDGEELTALTGANLAISVQGNDKYVNDAKVIEKDIHVGNSIVHLIDKVLIPPAISDIIINSDDHTILEDALKKAGLLETLSIGGPFTIFAPTDDAFEALPNGMLDLLFSDPDGLLTKTLKYHVVNGTYLSSDLYDGLKLPTLLGKYLTVTVNNEGVFVNDAKIIVTDIKTFNGVIHVIDVVLIPDMSTDLNDKVGANKEFSLFPNPASDFIQVSTSIETDGLLQYSIYNFAGVLIDKGKYMVDGGEDFNKRITLDNYSNGIYTIAVEISDRKFVKKFHVLK